MNDKQYQAAILIMGVAGLMMIMINIALLINPPHMDAEMAAQAVIDQ